MLFFVLKVHTYMAIRYTLMQVRSELFRLEFFVPWHLSAASERWSDPVHFRPPTHQVVYYNQHSAHKKDAYDRAEHELTEFRPHLKKLIRSSKVTFYENIAKWHDGHLKYQITKIPVLESQE